MRWNLNYEIRMSIKYRQLMIILLFDLLIFTCLADTGHFLLAVKLGVDR